MGAAGGRHAAARFTGITSPHRWKTRITLLTRRRGRVIRTPYALGLPLYLYLQPALQPVAVLTLDAQPQRRREVLRLVVLANAHASPVRLGLVLGEHALHLLPALVVQHA